MGQKIEFTTAQEDRFTKISCLWIVVLLILPPLFGVMYLDLPMAQYLEFPPETRYVSHASFSWPVFLVLLAAEITVCFAFIYRLLSYRPISGSKQRKDGVFPWWGWLGLFITVLFWVLAWNRFPFFRPLQAYTFTPLWVGYILAVNGLSCKRKGTCLMLSRPAFFLLLFPASSFFWWYFEYLNRFVQNWYYHAGANISTTEYIVHASICFSTVLPAFLATYEYLRTLPRFYYGFGHWHPVSFTGRVEGIGWLLLSAAVFSLAFLVVLPDYLFPLVWIAPLLVIVGYQLIIGHPTIFSGIPQGNWRQIVLPAVAALICGYFWEMWNWKSLAHWEYSIPFVERFRLFAMPALGYAGYLTFGLECLVVAGVLNEVAMQDERLFL